jgi:hypothetical protein
MSVQAPPARPQSTLPPTPPNDGAESRPSTRASRPVSTAPPPKQRKLSPRVRKALVAAHTIVAVGWLGIVVAKLVLEIVGLRTGDQEIARAGFLSMQVLDRAAFPPAAVATLVTGIVLSVGTAWGLFKHWWIVVKLALTLAVVVTGIAFVGAWTEAAASSTVAVGRGSAAAWLIGMGAAHLLMLVGATVISVFKPWGQIRPTPRPAGRG